MWPIDQLQKKNVIISEPDRTLLGWIRLRARPYCPTSVFDLTIVFLKKGWKFPWTPKSCGPPSQEKLKLLVINSSYWSILSHWTKAPSWRNKKNNLAAQKRANLDEKGRGLGGVSRGKWGVSMIKYTINIHELICCIAKKEVFESYVLFLAFPSINNFSCNSKMENHRQLRSRFI